MMVVCNLEQPLRSPFTRSASADRMTAQPAFTFPSQEKITMFFANRIIAKCKESFNHDFLSKYLMTYFQVSNEEIGQMIATVDRNGDGRISYSEFR